MPQSGSASGDGRTDGLWEEPYLETCCRSALHRLCLAGVVGRPPGLKDQPCLERLSRMGLACSSVDGRYHVTEDGRSRHRSEILSMARR